MYFSFFRREHQEVVDYSLTALSESAEIGLYHFLEVGETSLEVTVKRP